MAMNEVETVKRLRLIRIEVPDSGPIDFFFEHNPSEPMIEAEFIKNSRTRQMISEIERVIGKFNEGQ